MLTTAGSLALASASRAARRVRRRSGCAQAGAVILGKTNLTRVGELPRRRARRAAGARAAARRAIPTRSTATLAARARAPASPWRPAWCAAAIGTETDGSIVCPASVNGVVGIKPTVGLVSRRGIVPIAHSQDTAGPMARTVADAAIVLGAIAGRTRRMSPRRSRRTARRIPRGARCGEPAGRRIGVVRDHGGGGGQEVEGDPRCGVATLRAQVRRSSIQSRCHAPRTTPMTN